MSELLASIVALCDRYSKERIKDESSKIVENSESFDNFSQTMQELLDKVK